LKSGRTRRERVSGEDSLPVPEERKPGRSEGSGKQKAPTRIKPLSCMKGYGFLGGSKPLKHRIEAEKVFVPSARVEEQIERSFDYREGAKL
jgi:hypothetical protein